MTAPLTPEQRSVHFLNRTSFGPTRETIERANRIGARAARFSSPQDSAL